MNTIERKDLKDMMNKRDDMVLVEVLSTQAYNKEHLPHAINVPLDARDFGPRIQEQVPDKENPIVVYCANRACDLSPRAARALEDMGYRNVYDYEAGKEDWKSAGLPTES